MPSQICAKSLPEGTFPEKPLENAVEVEDVGDSHQLVCSPSNFPQ